MVSQHPLSQTLQLPAFLKARHFCSAAFRRPCWFHLLWNDGRWRQYAVQYAAVLFHQCGRGGYVCSASPGEKMSSRTSWSPTLPVFGGRKKLQSLFCVFGFECMWRESWCGNYSYENQLGVKRQKNVMVWVNNLAEMFLLLQFVGKSLKPRPLCV